MVFSILSTCPILNYFIVLVKMVIEKIIQTHISNIGYLENGVYHCEPDCFGKLVLFGKVL